MVQTSFSNKWLAQAIYDVDEFVAKFGVVKEINIARDQFLDYCKTNPTYDEAIVKFGAKVFEYELSGKIIVKNGKLQVV